MDTIFGNESKVFYPNCYVLPSDFPTIVPSLSHNMFVPSIRALRSAVSKLYRLDDFELVQIGTGFFSDVYKVTHKMTKEEMVLKKNKSPSNQNNMLQEVQLLNKLHHKHILRFMAACVHEGQLHALTEYINGGSLEQLIQRKNEELPWSVRMSLALDTAKGLAYLHSKGYFHRDLTSKNVLIKRNYNESLSAVIADFGLAVKIPSSKELRLPQVGSPYWMSPECLHGKYYDQQADSFSYGIILCELIGRLDADPDILPRTENFGVDYIAFSDLCSNCPPDFLKLAFRCVKIEPNSRPKARDLVNELEILTENQIKCEKQSMGLQIRKVRVEEEFVRRSPSEKARIHRVSVKCVGKEMSLQDPFYRPSSLKNPFSTLPLLREGRKIIRRNESIDLFSSCFEILSPARSPTPTSSSIPPPDEYCSRGAKSLPSSPTLTPSLLETQNRQFGNQSSFDDDSLFHGRVQLLRKIYSGISSSPISHWSTSVESFPLRRRLSCESGFFSSLGSDDNDYLVHHFDSSNRSVGSSLLTVSDLEEDLKAASAFLSSKRTSSIFTDSTDDLSSLAEVDEFEHKAYENDIRDIVEYFETTCKTNDKVILGRSSNTKLARSQKIDSLIKRVVEKESRERLFYRKSPQQQLCEGIVRSKLPLFDAAKKPRIRARLPYDQKGFVKARMALFDKPPKSNNP